MPPVLLEKSNCTYTKCYCEENVWKLCQEIQSKSDEVPLNAYAVFISNPQKTVPIWKQAASERKDTMVIWDYHVVLFLEDESLIYDLDTLLPFPCSLEKYAKEALKCDVELEPDYQHVLRVVGAAQFLQTFASDRSDMRNKDGSWKAPPPTYAPIFTADSKNNLPMFLDMMNDTGTQYGHLYTLEKFLQKFGKPRQSIIIL